MTFDFGAAPILETERLRLRRIVEADLQDWLDVMAHPAVHQYLIDFKGEPDAAEMRAIIEWTDEIFEHKTGIRWAITRPPDDRMIGSCGFHLYHPGHRRLEIGYELHRGCWRQGLMSEAILALMAFCFDRLAAHRIEADVTVGNAASAGLLRRLGFQLEGIWRDRVRRDGRFYSLWQFGILESEYRRRDGSA